MGTVWWGQVICLNGWNGPPGLAVACFVGTGHLPLTPAELARIAQLKAFAAKKEKVASLLAAEGLADEAEPHRQAAATALAQARSIEHREHPTKG